MVNMNKFRNIFSVFIVILGLVLMFAGASYAILSGNVSSENEHIIKAGSVWLKLTEDYDSISKKLSIQEDSEGLLQEDYYTFNISNIGSSPAQFSISLINDVPEDYTGNVLDTKYVKVGLEVNEKEYGPFTLEKVNNIIDSDIIYKKELVNYKLRLWLDKSKEEEINNFEDYKIFLKLKVNAEQRSNNLDNGS